MPTFCDNYLSACRKFFLFIFYAFTENLKNLFTKKLKSNAEKIKIIEN